MTAEPSRTSPWPARLSLAATLLAIVLVNALVLRNATAHEPTIGYDVGAHLHYARTLAQGRLPGPDDSEEFFAAPLAYLVPAVAAWFTDDWERLAESWQVANIVFSVILCGFLAALVRELAPGDSRWPLLAPAVAVCMLGTLPVYQKTFAMARPDAFLAMATVIAAVGVTRLCRAPESSAARWAACGLLLALPPLARQWGFFTALPMAGVLTLVAFRALPPRQALSRLLLAAGVAFAVGAPFYLSLQWRFGSMLTFNRDVADESEFIADAAVETPPRGVLPDAAFERPLRPHLEGRPAWIFYSDFWGDYWLYYSVHARHARGSLLAGTRAIDDDRNRRDPLIVASNYAAFAPILGGVNRTSLLPSALLLGGLGWAGVAAIRRWRRPGAMSGPLVLLAPCVATAIGYGWFVVAYTHGSSFDTAKGVYVAHAVPLLVAATTLMIARLGERWPVAAWLLVGTFAAVAVHNLPALLTTHV